MMKGYLVKAYILGTLGFLLSLAPQLAAEDREIRIPSEYESVGDRALGLNNMGTAGFDGLGALRINPSLLILNRSYSLGAAYNWPTGDARQYYQVGIVDGTTSKLVAAASYTGFTDQYENGGILSETDSPLIKRASVGAAYPLEYLALGFAAHFVEANEDIGFTTKIRKGVTLGLGALAYLSPSLRFGISIENFNNENLQNFAPETMRAGIDWLALDGKAEFFLDLRQRQRVKILEGALPQTDFSLKFDAEDLAGLEGPEQMAFVGSRIKMYDVLRWNLSYGQAFDESGRQSLASGLALVHQGFSLSFSLSRPYLDIDQLHSSMGLTLLLKI